MNEEQADIMIELLEKLAEKDLVKGHDIFDHPCSVAIRAIDDAFMAGFDCYEIDDSDEKLKEFKETEEI